MARFKRLTYGALVWAMLSLNPAQAWAVRGTVELETGDVLNGDISIPPNDEIEMVLADSSDRASIPIKEIKQIDVADPPQCDSAEASVVKRFWRRLTGPSKAEQTLTVTLRNGDVHEGRLSWRRSEGLIEVRLSKYVVRKVYVRPVKTDRQRHQPLDVSRQYVRSIRFAETERAAQKRCSKCGRLFEQSDYVYCPFDGTLLTESASTAKQ